MGVLVAQLGTPDEPTPRALRRYLKQFLSDMRVVDYNPFLWQLLLRLIILNTRPRKSARLYQRIWLPEGSPLLVYSEQQVAGLQARLGDGYRVVLGMTYGNPSIGSAIQSLEDVGIDRILVFPMYPQYSSSTTASVYDAVNRAAFGRRCPLFFDRKRSAPTLRFVEPYYDHPAYIEALKQAITDYLAEQDQAPDKYLFSFHGIPRRYAKTGDPYHKQCEVSAQLLATSLGLAESDWQLTYQSRFGPEPWLQPYTDETIEAYGKNGIRRLLAACPGFTTDCLETLDEIGNEGGELFHKAGGGELMLAPCLNAHPAWLDAMTAIVRQETEGWLARPRGATALPYHSEAAD
ncbi:MAG: ferrochelatase [Chloroflexi bacterium]|nr:ferrochelatase [Chloroflexota bacterium]